MNLNSVTLTGNLVRDPETRAEGVCSMRLAVNDRRKVGEEWEDYANYINVTAFGKLAENCLQYLDKGRPIAVLGTLRWHAWEKDGERREAIEVIARQVQFLSRANEARAESGEEGAVATPGTAPSEPPVEGSDEAPF